MSDTAVVEWDPRAYEYDPKPSDYHPTEKQERVAVIRTSDRIAFRRCRRRWGWSSHLRGNRTTLESPAPLWTGVGFHYAMEDFHGLKEWPSAGDAFLAYAAATYAKAKWALPGNYQEQTDLAVAMLNYYEHRWLPNRNPLQTFIYNGVPQLEVNFRIDIPWQRGRYGYDRVVYSGTIDRVVIDEYQRLWPVDYKTAKSIFTLHFANDPQISAYDWAAKWMYPGYEIGGFIYQQHRKEIPLPPEVKANGKISTALNQRTTRAMYRDALINQYGSIERSPLPMVDALNYYATREDGDKDLFIQRNRIYRNEHTAQAEGAKILMEIEEMLNPDLPLYPNPSRDCPYLCPFADPCVSMDDGSDWQHELDLLTTERDKDYDIWRKHLPVPPQRSAELPQVKQPLLLEATVPQ